MALEQLVHVIVDAAKQLRVERADGAEALRARRIAVGMRGAGVGDRLVGIHLRPVVIVGGRGQMRRGHEREDPAGVGQRRFRRGRAGAPVLAQQTAPRFRLGVGIVEQSAPKTVAIVILLPVLGRL